MLEKVLRGAAIGDLFNTGTQDIVVRHNMHSAPTLLHNCRGAGAAWWYLINALNCARLPRNRARNTSLIDSHAARVLAREHRECTSPVNGRESIARGGGATEIQTVRISW